MAAGHREGGGKVATYLRTYVPTNVPPYPPRGERVTTKRLGAEDRALVREARSVWEQSARKCANPYVDSAALLLVGRMTLEATQWEDGLVILDAIKERMDPKSSPRRIPEWAREEGGKKREAEHTKRKSEELNAPWDPGALSAARAFLAAKKRERYTAPTAVPVCSECRQLTDGKCQKCGTAVHPKVCSKQHRCAA